jgi:hypothetical protein
MQSPEPRQPNLLALKGRQTKFDLSPLPGLRGVFGLFPVVITTG